MINHRSDLEPIKVCPRCGNETSEEILNEIGGCYFCGNTDFSEGAYRLPDDTRKLNCSLCGKLMTLKELHRYNPMFYKFSKKINVGRFDWIDLCPRCDSDANPRQDLKIIRKITNLHGQRRGRT